jgi:integrase
MPVYKDKKRETWYASFYYTDWSGNRKLKKKRGFIKKGDAQAFEREFLNKERQSSDMTLNSLIELYYEDMGARLRETTMDNKRFMIDTKIIPYFKNMPINKINAASIRKWQNTLIKDQKGYAQTYLKTINNQFNAILNYAVKYYGLPSNPMHIAGSMGKKKADEMQIWTVDEFKQFIKVVDKPAFKLVFEVMFWTGLRIGEALALTPNDILSEKVIDVNKSLARKNGEDRIYDPKTTKSARQVPIPDFLFQEIQCYLKSIYGIQPSDKIFYMTKSTLNKALTSFAALAGVKKIRVHDLRHSHASLLIEMGYDILLISKRLGHENVETTWNTYGHLYPNKQIKLAEDLEKFKK